MLLAVEGGGFFSSSASGYSKGLTLLLLGQKNEEKPMRVAPWNQYQLVDQETDPQIQLVDQETDPQIQLAPPGGKNRIVCGCATFVCFGRPATGLESSPSQLKVGHTQHQENLPKTADSDKCRDQSDSTQSGEDCDDNYEKFTLRSSLKRPSTSNPVVEDGNDERSAFCGKDSDAVINTEARTVQWTDASGGELAEIREFEPSDDDGFDDEFDNGHQKTCACTIM